MDETKTYHLKELAALAGKTLSNLANQLRRLMDDHLIERTGRGTYAKVIVSREVREVREVSEVSEVSEYIVEQRFIHSDDRSEVGREYRLPLQEAGNDLIHELHADSHIHEKPASLVDRVKKVGESSPLDAIPEALRMTTRMMLVSGIERNQDTARARCAEYGIDFDTARAWAFTLSQRGSGI
mgnify:CR=1 FL=1